MSSITYSLYCKSNGYLSDPKRPDLGISWTRNKVEAWHTTEYDRAFSLENHFDDFHDIQCDIVENESDSMDRPADDHR